MKKIKNKRKIIQAIKFPPQTPSVKQNFYPRRFRKNVICDSVLSTKLGRPKHVQIKFFLHHQYKSAA